jgi:hypothetical protein
MDTTQQNKASQLTSRYGLVSLVIFGLALVSAIPAFFESSGIAVDMFVFAILLPIGGLLIGLNGYKKFDRSILTKLGIALNGVVCLIVLVWYVFALR